MHLPPHLRPQARRTSPLHRLPGNGRGAARTSRRLVVRAKGLPDKVVRPAARRGPRRRHARAVGRAVVLDAPRRQRPHTHGPAEFRDIARLLLPKEGVGIAHVCAAREFGQLLVPVWRVVVSRDVRHLFPPGLYLCRF